MSVIKATADFHPQWRRQVLAWRGRYQRLASPGKQRGRDQGLSDISVRLHFDVTAWKGTCNCTAKPVKSLCWKFEKIGSKVDVWDLNEVSIHVNVGYSISVLDPNLRLKAWIFHHQFLPYFIFSLLWACHLYGNVILKDHNTSCKWTVQHEDQKEGAGIWRKIFLWLTCKEAAAADERTSGEAGSHKSQNHRWNQLQKERRRRDVNSLWLLNEQCIVFLTASVSTCRWNVSQ